MDYFLKQVEPGNPHPLIISLHEDVMKIGRSTIASLSRYNRVSRHHASFTKRNDCWFLTDLASLNCLYVNFKEVQHTVQLNIGDIIGFGSPNISQDGGFVCVLAARKKVVVKQEPLDDDCIEIPVEEPAVKTMPSTSISTIVECTAKCHIPTDIEALKHKPEVLGSKLPTYSNTYVPCKIEPTTHDHSQNFDEFPKLQSFQSNHMIEDPLSVKRMCVDLKHTDSAMSPEVQKLVHVNPVVASTDFNINNMKSVTETAYDLKSRETNSETFGYKVDHTRTISQLIDTQCPQMSAYPGIEYLEGVSNVTMESESFEKAVVNNSSPFNLNSVQDTNLETVSNSCAVKQEIHCDIASTVSKSNKLNTAVVSSSKIASVENGISSTSANDFQNYNSSSKSVDSKPISNYFSSDSVLNSIDRLGEITDSFTGSFNTASFTGNTLTENITVDNLLNNRNKQNIRQEKHSNYKKNSPNELFTSAMDNARKWSNPKYRPDFNCSEKGEVVNQYETLQSKKLLVNNLETEKNTDCLTEQECSIPLVRCDSTYIQEFLNIDDTSKVLSSKKNTKHKKITDLYDTENSIKNATNLKDLISETHGKMVFSNSTNLKIKSNKILSREYRSSLDGYEEENMMGNPCSETSTKPNTTVTRKLTEQFSNTISQNLNQSNETTTKSFPSSTNKIDNVKRHNLNAKVSLGLSISKEETRRSQKLLDDSSDYQHHAPLLSVSVKRKRDTKSKRDLKRIKTKDREENYFSSSSYSEFNSLSINTKETIESNKTSTVSQVVRSKERYSNEYSPLRTPLFDEAVNEETNVVPHQNGSKSKGRTLLIDSKPIEYRPRTRRGKEEWFQERSEELGSKNIFAKSFNRSSFSHDNQNSKISNTESLKNVETSVLNLKKQNTKYCSQKKKEKETLKCHQKTKERTHHQRKLVENAHVSQRPPVPRRRNSFSSRMGFLIDMPVKHMSTNNNKQQMDILKQIKKNHNSLTNQPDTMSSEGKMMPHKNKIPNKDQETTSKRNSTQTSNRSQTDYSTFEQYSTKENQSLTSTDEVFVEKGVASLDMDYRLEDDTAREQRKEPSESRIISNKILNSDKTISINCNQFPNSKIVTYSKKVAIISPMHKAVNEIPKCQSSLNESKWLNASSTLLVEMIVSWNPKWLEEQKHNKNPPPLIIKNASYLNSSFSSYKSYASSYFPMIVLEVWECLFRESKPFLEQFQNWNNFCFTIKSWENRRNLTELKCESLVSDVLCYQPSKGKIILLNILDKEEHGIKNYIFGCIRRHTIEEFKRGSFEWENMPADALNNAKLVKFELFIKKIKQPMRMKSVYLAHGLLDINDKMQLADALYSFRDSQLCKDIYHPREESFMFCYSSRKPLSMVNLIEAISKEVRNLKSKSRIIFIHAPPATGKTKLVVDLVKKLTSDNRTKTKMMVCTPSYSTLDDILSRLVESGNTCSNLSSMVSVKFVRLSEHERIESIDSKLKEYSLLSKVEKLYREDCTKKMQRRECELKLLEEKINDILFKQCNDHGKYRKVNKDSTLQVLIKKMSSVKKNLLHPMDEGFRKGYECIVLKESDVLLTTLESSMQPAVRTFLKEKNEAYCIVDDATQCNELQLLQCLHHPQISKLILLGDSKQMSPTVCSQYAAKYGFDRSTVERFCLHYRKKFHKVPCSTLKEQHRMHSEICHFPSRYFYNHELQTAYGIDERFARFPFKPYNVIDILEQGPISDETVSTLIVYICSILVSAAPTASIGVIVDKCGLAMPWEYNNVEVNTLENLQGREKDIVLIPCIRPFAPSDDFLSCEKRLNVALTRAKQCLVICGRVSSQVQFPHWRALLDDAMNRNCYLCVASIRHIPLVFANFIKK